MAASADSRRSRIGRGISPLRGWWRFALIQVVLLAALVWAHFDPLVVRVDLGGEQPVAEIEGVRLEAPSRTPTEPRLALYVEGQARAAPSTEWRWAAEEVAAPLIALDAEQGWRDVVLTGPDGRIVWEHRFPRDGLDGWSDPEGLWHPGMLGDATSGWTAFLRRDVPTATRLEATLQRGREGAGVAIEGRDGTGGLLLLVRPVHRDLMWWRLQDGQWHGPLAGAAYVRPWYSALQDLLRLLLRPYALALVGGAGLIAASALLRRWRRHEGNPSEADVAMPAAIAAPLVAMIAVGILAATSFIAYFLLERIPHVQDSVAYLFQARVFALGRLWAPLPALPEFFEHEFVVMQDGRWFAKYPPGWPLLLSAGVLAGVPWLVNPLLAALSAVATYAIGARTMGRGGGVIAALLLALSPFFLFLAGEYMAHTSGLLFALLFALFYVGASRGSSVSAVLAGVAIGFDFLIRPWTAVTIAAPFGIDLLVRALRRRPEAVRTIVMIAGGALPLVAVWLAYNWALAGHPLKNTMELWWSFDRIGFGPDKGIGGHTPLNGLYNTLRNLEELSRHAFGWPSVATFALAFVPFATRRASRWDWLWLGGWLSLMLGYFFWWADGVMYGPRFYLEAMGFLALLSGRGFQILSSQLGGVSRIGAAIVLTALLLFNLLIYMPAHLPLLRGYNYVSRTALDRVTGADVHNAVVFVDPGPVAEWWNYGMVFSGNDPLLDGDVLYARDLGTRNGELMRVHPDRRFYRLTRDGQIVEIFPEQEA